MLSGTVELAQQLVGRHLEVIIFCKIIDVLVIHFS